MEITVIGAGVMGSAFAQAWVTHKLIAPKYITVCDFDARKLERLKRELHVQTSRDSFSAVTNVDIILLAVKPQQIYTILEEISDTLRSTQLIISIAAGVTIRSIEKIIGRRQPVVRAMPNLPLTVGAGATVWCANKRVTSSQLKTAQTLLSAGAMALKIPERKLNAVTAISGSGPGYLFAFADALMHAARSVGLSQIEADALVRATVAGAGRLLIASSLAPSALVSLVASKGGTTEAALNIFKQKKLAEIISAAVRAAYARARGLSR